ncbi:5984_t:CDS:1 [Funneliformis geosporum]|uniref:10159_t:CDS:1 n=1 Tax=Funneliformis geosporum TaxID=1117311 RepID=A0A9W4SZS8_9GLOM|nr:5984_t:CDS:1 [Funneliformis geosporum]CAI2185130.1 10159_t:CDS:1 [Funneliformis geosporum]
MRNQSIEHRNLRPRKNEGLSKHTMVTSRKIFLQIYRNVPKILSQHFIRQPYPYNKAIVLNWSPLIKSSNFLRTFEEASLSINLRMWKWRFAITNHTRRKHSALALVTTKGKKSQTDLEVFYTCDQINQRYLQHLIDCFRKNLERRRSTNDIFLTYDDLSKKDALRLLNENDYTQLITRLKDYNSKDFALHWLNRFFSDMKSAKLNLSLNTYGLMIVMYGKWGEYDKAENIFVEICQKNISYDVYTYNKFIYIYANIGNLQRVYQLLQDMKSKSIHPNLSTYNIIILAYVRNKNITGALSLLYEIEEKGLQPDVVTFNTIINGLLQLNDFKSAERCFEKMSSMRVRPNARTFNTLMSSYSKMGDYQYVEKLYNKMIEMNIQPSPDSYFTLMSAYVHSGKKHQVLEIMNQLKTRNWKSLRVYNMLIHLYIRLDDFSMAREIFCQISESALKPNVVTFNTFINGYINRQNLKDAIKYFDEMVKSGISPNVEVYNTLLKGYLNAYGISTVEKIFTQMSTHDIAPDVITYNTLIQYIKGQNKIDDFERAIDQYRIMVKKLIKPSDRTFNILLNLVMMRDLRRDIIHHRQLTKYQESKGLEELTVKDILKEMKSKGYIIDVVTYSILIKNFVQYKKMDEAEKLLQQMTNNGIKPNQYIFNIMIDGYSKSYNMIMAQQAVKKMINSGYQKDQKAYTSLINGYVNIGEFREGQREFEEMKRTGIIPDNIVYSSLIDMFANEKNIRNAQKVFDHMRTQGIPMDKITYTVLMKAYALDGNINGACSIYNEMIKEGCEPDEVVISTMLSAYKRGKNIKGVIDFLKDSKINMYLNTRNYNILLNILSQERDLSGAYKLFMKMLESYDHSSKSSLRVNITINSHTQFRHPPPDLDSLKIILKRFSYRRRWDLIMLIWDATDQRGIKPSIEDFLIFIKAFAMARDKKNLMQICEKFIIQDPPYHLVSHMKQILIIYGIPVGFINELSENLKNRDFT